MTIRIDEKTLQRIWHAHGLGDVGTAIQPARGSINHALIVNDTYVIRFDVLNKLDSHFLNERVAYEALRSSGIPVPEVVALDDSRTVVPYEYIISRKMPGTPIIDSWDDLAVEQRDTVARAVGQSLATMHGCRLDHFGALRQAEQPRFATWFAYVEDYFQRYAAQALDLGVLHAGDRDRIHAILRQYEPLLDQITAGYLVHSDYHFENILQVDGRVTAVIDFEWALAGDPSWDFIVEDKWDAMCPGSAESVLGGYTGVRALDADHPTRVAIYKLLMYVESVVDFTNWEQADLFEETRARLFETLAFLEFWRI